MIVASDGSDSPLLTLAIKVESLWFVAVVEFDAAAALTAAKVKVTSVGFVDPVEVNSKASPVTVASVTLLMVDETD